MGYTPALGTRPEDLGVNNYAGVGGGVLNQEVVSNYDIYKPNELVQVFERHGYKPGFRLMLKTFGFSRGTAAPTTGHYEYPWRTDLFKIGTIVTPAAGAGNNMVVSIDATQMFDSSVNVGGSARKASYPREKDLVYFPNHTKAMIVKKDTTTDPHRFTLRPVDSTVDLDSSVTAGESYFLSDNAHAEGSGLPSGRVSRVIKYSNTFQIIKEACASTGSEMTNETYFEPLPDTPGSFYLKTKFDTYYRFEKACDGGLLFGQQIDNITEFVPELGHDVPVKGTEGFIDFALTNGYEDNYTIGAYALDDFYIVGDFMEDERIGVRELAVWQGKTIFNEVEQVLFGELNQTTDELLTKNLIMMSNPDDDMQPWGSEDWAMSIGFYALKVGGYHFGFKLLHEFNNVKGAGASDYDFKNWQVITPLGYTKDKNTGTQMPTVGYEYKSLNGFSRENVVAELAGVGVAGSGTPYRIATKTSDVHTCGFVSECSFHATCGNHITIQKPA